VIAFSHTPKIGEIWGSLGKHGKSVLSKMNSSFLVPLVVYYVASSTFNNLGNLGNLENVSRVRVEVKVFLTPYNPHNP
jgi:hypothetical protein